MEKPVNTYLQHMSWNKRTAPIVPVLDLASWVRIAVLMNVYLGWETPWGSGFWNEGYMSQGRKMDGLVYEQPEETVDGPCHSKEGSK